jgi:hypothetical protein
VCAWELLTSEPADLQDPREALRFALQANELTGFEDHLNLDTLAFAYHRTDRHAEAVDTQRKAISLLPPGDKNRTGYEERLEEYQAALSARRP